MTTSQPELDVSKRLHKAIHDVIDHLESQLAVVQARLDDLAGGGFDPEVSKAGAALARAIKDASGEARQLERHDRRMTLTPEQRWTELCKYVRTLNRQQLGELSGLLAELTKERAL